VIVSAPTVVKYDINFTYYINKKDEAKVSIIQNAVQNAVNDFIAWTKSKIERDVENVLTCQDQFKVISYS
jgi:hypothetical protein